MTTKHARARDPIFFFFNDTATTEIYTLSLHDALPISHSRAASGRAHWPAVSGGATMRDRKSTRLNSSHTVISYAVFCLKKITCTNKVHCVPDCEHHLVRDMVVQTTI